MHIEDQVAAKRCGHRPGKAIVPQAEMVDRVKAAVEAGAAGFELDRAWEEMEKLDLALGSELNFAFSSRFGYLTTCPTNVGTGMRASRRAVVAMSKRSSWPSEVGGSSGLCRCDHSPASSKRGSAWASTPATRSRTTSRREAWAR